MKWYKLPDTVKQSTQPIQVCKVGGQRICLIQDQGKWYATSSKCPHAGGDLGSGWCENGQLICPRHRQRFDLQTGKGAAEQYNAIRTFNLEEREDGLYVELPVTLLQKLRDQL